jgi:hypothetical protein
MVALNASAQVVYDGGCRENIRPGTVDVVKGNSLKDAPVCAGSGASGGSADSSSGSGGAGPAVSRTVTGEAAATLGGVAITAEPAAAEAIAGAAFTAAVVGAGIFLEQKPASP